MSATYSLGLLIVENGSKSVTLVGGLAIPTTMKVGDAIAIEGDVMNAVASITDPTHFELVRDFGGADQADASYILFHMPLGWGDSVNLHEDISEYLRLLGQGVATQAQIDAAIGAAATATTKAAEAVAARDIAVPAAATATTKAAEATAASAAAVPASIAAVAAKVSAEAARDASMVAGNLYATEALGRAAVGDGVSFDVVGDVPEVASRRYRRVNSGSSTLLTSTPSSAAVTAIGTKIDGLVFAATAGVTIPGSAVLIIDMLVDGTGRPIEYTDSASVGWFFDTDAKLQPAVVATEQRLSTGVFIPGFSQPIASVEYDLYGRPLEILDTAGRRWAPTSAGTFEKLTLPSEQTVQEFPNGIVIPGLPVQTTGATLFSDGRVAEIVGQDSKDYRIGKRSRWISSYDHVDHFDVLVYGSGVSGLMAMLRASLRGLRVCIIEPYRFFGGMHANGMTLIDAPDSTTNFETTIMGGLTNSVYLQMLIDMEGGDPKWKYLPQAKNAEIVAQRLIADYSARSLRNSPLDGRRSVLMTVDQIGRTKIRGVMANEELITAETFIDASYEGDLMAAALGPTGYYVGRESVAQYGETGAGYRGPAATIFNLAGSFPSYSGAGSVAAIGYPVVPDPGMATGDADKLVQAYNYRLPMTRDPANRRPFRKPSGYSTSLVTTTLQQLKNSGYTKFARDFTAQSLGLQANAAGNKPNWNALDLVNRSRDYPEANWTQKGDLNEEHALYQQSMFWCIQNDPIMLDYGLGTLQADAQDIGLCEDEFESSPLGHGWPYWLYARETRRLKSVTFMTLQDTAIGGTITKATSIGKWSYYPDIHVIQHHAVPGYTDRLVGEGSGNSHTPTAIYQIPAETMLPPVASCTNLIVSFCTGSSHMAWAPERLELPSGFKGEAAGEIAAWRARNPSQPVQNYSYAEVSAALLDGRSKL